MRRERRRNGGLRKRCGCPRKTWTKCPHSWHFNLKVRGGPHYRICLDREVGKHIDSKAEAVKVAADIRAAILAGTFRAKPEPAHVAAPPLTFRAFAEVWKERRGKDLVSAPLDKYRLSTICKFALPATDPLRLFGDLPLEHVTADHIETFRDARKRGGLSAVSINHDLRLLRKMFNWAVRKGGFEPPRACAH